MYHSFYFFAFRLYYRWKHFQPPYYLWLVFFLKVYSTILLKYISSHNNFPCYFYVEKRASWKVTTSNENLPFFFENKSALCFWVGWGMKFVAFDVGLTVRQCITPLSFWRTSWLLWVVLCNTFRGRIGCIWILI